MVWLSLINDEQSLKQFSSRWPHRLADIRTENDREEFLSVNSQMLPSNNRSEVSEVFYDIHFFFFLAAGICQEKTKKQANKQQSGQQKMIWFSNFYNYTSL